MIQTIQNKLFQSEENLGKVTRLKNGSVRASTIYGIVNIHQDRTYLASKLVKIRILYIHFFKNVSIKMFSP